MKQTQVRRKRIPLAERIERTPRLDLEVGFERTKKWKLIPSQERFEYSARWPYEPQKRIHTHPEDKEYSHLYAGDRAFIVDKAGRRQIVPDSFEISVNSTDVNHLMLSGRSSHIAFMHGGKVAGYILIKKTNTTPTKIDFWRHTADQNSLLKNLAEWENLRNNIAEIYIQVPKRHLNRYLRVTAFLKNPKNWEKAGLLARAVARPGFEIVKNKWGFDYLRKKEE